MPVSTTETGHYNTLQFFSTAPLHVLLTTSIFGPTVLLCACERTPQQHVSKTYRTTNLGPPNAFAANHWEPLRASRRRKETIGYPGDGFEAVCDHPAAWRRCLRRRKPFLGHARSARSPSRRCYASIAGLWRYTRASSGERLHG